MKTSVTVHFDNDEQERLEWVMLIRMGLSPRDIKKLSPFERADLLYIMPVLESTS